MTNQASEDELLRKAILKILHQTESCTGCKDHYKKPHKCDMDLAAPRCVKRVRELEALIRTEKLKLLAEVRERVVGEEEPYLDEPSPAFEGAYEVANTMIEAQNNLRSKQITELTKLEAEL